MFKQDDFDFAFEHDSAAPARGGISGWRGPDGVEAGAGEVWPAQQASSQRGTEPRRRTTGAGGGAPVVATPVGHSMPTFAAASGGSGGASLPALTPRRTLILRTPSRLSLGEDGGISNVASAASPSSASGAGYGTASGAIGWGASQGLGHSIDRAPGPAAAGLAAHATRGVPAAAGSRGAWAEEERLRAQLFSRNAGRLQHSKVT